VTGIDQDLLLRVARGLNLVSALSLFGIVVFALAIAAPLARQQAGIVLLARLQRLLLASALLNLASAAAWLPMQARAMAGPAEGYALIEQLTLVATGSTFGRALLLRTLLLAAGALLAGGLSSRLRLAAATLAALAGLALQSRLGHAAAADSALLAIAGGLHVVAAGAWIGGLVPLAIAIATLPGTEAGFAARRFSWIGLAAIGTLIATAFAQADALIGDLGGWFGTPYGLWALAKIAGLLTLLLLAAINRFIFTPRLDAATGRRGLVASIGVETAVGLAVVIAAVALATSPPAAHEQSWWPFPLRPDTDRWDLPYIRAEIDRAAIFAAVLLAGFASLWFRRTRLIGPLIAVLLVAFWLPRPNLRLLVKPAVPTSYQRSETGYSSASIVQGLALLKRFCTSDCFRPADDPSDLTPYGIWARPDGDLYWWLTAVFDRIGHSPLPYGTIAGLQPRERWQLIDYFRARVAGSAARSAGNWNYPVLAPDLPLLCDGAPTDLAALRGRVLRLVATPTDGRLELPEPPPELPVTTLLLTRDEPASASLSPGVCTSSSPDAWTAFAIIAGVDEDRLAGTVLLIDANGWLRSRVSGEPSEQAPPGEDPDERIRRIAAAPFAIADIGSHRH
jgi:putative copper export protein